jgi:hypothetical protein
LETLIKLQGDVTDSLKVALLLAGTARCTQAEVQQLLTAHWHELQF